MDYESADRWNLLHPVGTPVSVRLLGGVSFEAQTRSMARQWGNYAIVSLTGHPGMWTTTAMAVREPGHSDSDASPQSQPASARAEC